MAKLKVKVGDSEVEIDSRDFYIDNNTLEEVVDLVSRCITTTPAVHTPSPTVQTTRSDPLETLDDAEVFEPEFSEPVPVSGNVLHAKIQILASKSFFDIPRTRSDIVSHMRECGWVATPLEVSKALTKMTMTREITRNSDGNKNVYIMNSINN